MADIARALLLGALETLEADPALASRVRNLLTPSTQADDSLTLANTGISVRTLRAAIKAGELPASKVGREYRVRRADLTAWIASRRVANLRHSQHQAERSPAERAIARAAANGKLRVVGGSR